MCATEEYATIIFKSLINKIITIINKYPTNNQCNFTINFKNLITYHTPKPPIFSKIPAKIIEPRVDAST